MKFICAAFLFFYTSYSFASGHPQLPAAEDQGPRFGIYGHTIFSLDKQKHPDTGKQREDNLRIALFEQSLGDAAYQMQDTILSTYERLIDITSHDQNMHSDMIKLFHLYATHMQAAGMIKESVRYIHLMYQAIQFFDFYFKGQHSNQEELQEKLMRLNGVFITLLNYLFESPYITQTFRDQAVFYIDSHNVDMRKTPNLAKLFRLVMRTEPGLDHTRFHKALFLVTNADLITPDTLENVLVIQDLIDRLTPFDLEIHGLPHIIEEEEEAPE